MRKKRVKGNILGYDTREEIVLPWGDITGKDVLNYSPATARDALIEEIDRKVFGFFGQIGRTLIEEFNDVYAECASDYRENIAPVIENVRSAVKGYLDNVKNSGVTLKITG